MEQQDVDRAFAEFDRARLLVSPHPAPALRTLRINALFFRHTGIRPMWADQAEVHCEQCGVPEVGYLLPRRTVSVRFAEAPQSLTIPTTNAFSALSLCQPSADDEVAEEDRPPFSEVLLSQPPTPEASRPPSPDPPASQTPPQPAPQPA